VGLLEKAKAVVPVWLLRYIWESPNIADPFLNHYVEWRDKRIKAITEHYGVDWFRGKKLLEVGCGYGDIGASFATLGAEVTCSDGRAEHLAVVRQRYPKVRALLADIDGHWPFTEKYDMIIHLGVLYHLKDHEVPLRQACAAAPHLVLETEVCDSDDPYKVIHVVENSNVYDQALHSRGCRPSGANIERILADCGMGFERLDNDSCNAGYHRYDWPVRHTGAYENGLRRLWFASTR
jgi:SAM-dependent methyltransferase